MTLQYGPAIDLGFVDKRRSDTPTNTSPLATQANYATEATLDTRLTTIGYSALSLRCMTTNDKVYALRVSDDSAGIN